MAPVSKMNLNLGGVTDKHCTRSMMASDYSGIETFGDSYHPNPARVELPEFPNPLQSHENSIPERFFA